MASAAGSGGGRSQDVSAASSAFSSASGPACAPLPQRSSRRAHTCRWPLRTTKRPTTRAFPSCRSTRRRPLAISSGRSSTTVPATPTGAKRHRSRVRRSGFVPARSSSAPVSSDTVSAEHLLLVCQLARVLDQETGAAHELVGLLGQHAFVALGLVLLVRRLLVLGLVLDDEAFLEDDVQAGLDVLVVGLLFLFFLVALTRLLDDRGRRGGQDLVDVSLRLVVLLVEDDEIVIVVCERVDFDLFERVRVDVDVEVVLRDGFIVLDFGGLGRHVFDFGFLLGGHCAAGA